jgi:hypothetical protein
MGIKDTILVPLKGFFNSSQFKDHDCISSQALAQQSLKSHPFLSVGLH